MDQGNGQVRYDRGGWISGPCLSVPLNQPPGMSPEGASALWMLRECWDMFYGIAVVDDVWRAHRLGNVTKVITADSSNELSGLIWQDFNQWQREAPK